MVPPFLLRGSSQTGLISLRNQLYVQLGVQLEGEGQCHHRAQKEARSLTSRTSTGSMNFCSPGVMGWSSAHSVQALWKSSLLSPGASRTVSGTTRADLANGSEDTFCGGGTRADMGEATDDVVGLPVVEASGDSEYCRTGWRPEATGIGGAGASGNVGVPLDVGLRFFGVYGAADTFSDLLKASLSVDRCEERGDAAYSGGGGGGGGAEPPLGWNGTATARSFVL